MRFGVGMNNMEIDFSRYCKAVVSINSIYNESQRMRGREKPMDIREGPFRRLWRTARARDHFVRDERGCVIFFLCINRFQDIQIHVYVS